jgi:hypothetical protein
LVDDLCEWRPRAVDRRHAAYLRLLPRVAHLYHRDQHGHEQAAIWAAAAKDATGALGASLIKGLSAGTVDLTSSKVKTWMDALVTAEAITADRETAIPTP